MPNTILALKLAARKALAEHMAGPPSEGDRVIIMRNGRKLLDLVVPCVCEDVKEGSTSVAPAETTTRRGWDFTGSIPRHEGKPVQITGRKLDVLKLLAASSQAMTVEQLRAAWDDYDIAEQTVRWTVGELKKSLAELFPGLAEPVSNDGDGSGYRLLIR